MSRFLPRRRRAWLLVLTAAIVVCCALPAGAFAAESGGFSEGSTPDNGSGSTGWVPQGESTGGSSGGTAPQHGSSLGSGSSGTQSKPPPPAPVETPDPPATQAPPSEPSTESSSEPESSAESDFEETAATPLAESNDDTAAPPVTQKKDTPAPIAGATQVIAPVAQAPAKAEATPAPAAVVPESDGPAISSTTLLLIALVLAALLFALVTRRRAAERIPIARKRAQAQIDRTRRAKWEATLLRVEKEKPPRQVEPKQEQILRRVKPEPSAEADQERRNGQSRPVKVSSRS